MGRHNSDDIDGGVRRNVVLGLSPDIESHFIIKFHLKAYNFHEVDSDLIGEFEFEAKYEGELVKAKMIQYDENDRRKSVEFMCDKDIMFEIDKIIRASNLLEMNGSEYTVSGLPPRLGATISALYDTKEELYIHDNQSNFIPDEMIKALLKLFDEKATNFFKNGINMAFDILNKKKTKWICSCGILNTGEKCFVCGKIKEGKPVYVCEECGLEYYNEKPLFCPECGCMYDIDI